MDTNWDKNAVPDHLSSGGIFQPWEQRIGPGMGGGGGSSSSPEPEFPDRLLVAAAPSDVEELIDEQARLAYLPMVNRHQPSHKDLSKTSDSNEEVWLLFKGEQLYDTRRVTLEHFHLFEWFPLNPGKFHTDEGRAQRGTALGMMFTTPEGHKYFDPSGKASMIKGGVGAVRLRPRRVASEPYYFMSVSSNGVCHEGFPVLVPRHFYAQVKPRLLSDGAVAVTISGEMRYLYEDLPAIFETHREIPTLYLHVDELSVLASPRQGVSAYTVSTALSFVGEYQDREGVYVTYATFDPSSEQSLDKAISWMEQYYVTTLYKGVIITDFDEVHPRFPNAVFGLPDLMAGKIDQGRVKEFLSSQGLSPNAGKKFFVVYKEINTQGGAYIEGNVDTGGGDFIGRDQIINN